MSIRAFKGHRPRIAASAFVDETAVVIGRASIGEDASLWPFVVVRADVHEISIGARTNVQDGTVIHCTSPNRQFPDGFPTIVGDDVTVGHQAILHACRIGHHCLIGMAACVMDGAVIEPYTVVGAGALVAPGKRLQSGLWVGSPARRVRDLTPAEIDHLDYSAGHYVNLQRAHAAGC